MSKATCPEIVRGSPELRVGEVVGFDVAVLEEFVLPPRRSYVAGVPDGPVRVSYGHDLFTGRRMVRWSQRGQSWALRLDFPSCAVYAQGSLLVHFGQLDIGDES